MLTTKDRPVLEAHHHLSGLIASEALDGPVVIPVVKLDIEHLTEADCLTIASNTSKKFLVGPQSWYDWHVAYVHELKCFVAISRQYAKKLVP